MNKFDIKKILHKESKKFVPNIKDRILSSIEPVSKQHRPSVNFVLKPALLFSLTFFLIVIVGITFFISDDFNVPRSTTYVSIDINPSIELQVDNENVVTSVRPLNVDAALLLEDASDLVGTKTNETIQQIIDLSIELGYLDINDPNQDIYVNAINDNQNVEDEINNEIKDYFKNNLKVKVQEIKEEIRKKARMNRVTARKMALVEKVNQLYNIPIDEALKLQVSELNEKIRNYSEEKMTEFKTSYLDKVNQLSDIKNHAIDQYNQNHQDVINRIHTIKNKIEKHENIFLIRIYTEDLINTYFPNYDAKNLFTFNDYLEFYTTLEVKVNEQKDLIYNIINEKYNTQIKSYRNKVREDLKQSPNEYKFDFAFDTDFSFEQFKNNYLNLKETQVLILIEKINVLMRIGKGNNLIKNRIDVEIEANMRVYNELMNAEEIRDAFKESNFVKQFEINYQEYQNK